MAILPFSGVLPPVNLASAAPPAPSARAVRRVTSRIGLLPILVSARHAAPFLRHHSGGGDRDQFIFTKKNMDRTPAPVIRVSLAAPGGNRGSFCARRPFRARNGTAQENRPVANSPRRARPRAWPAARS